MSDSVSNMADIRDQMEMSETEDAESEYFQNVTTSFDDNLEESINSMQGSFALPTFAFGQSNELQGSQGFQFVALSGGSGGSDSSSTKSQSDRGEASRINNQLTLQALLLASQNSVIAPSNNQVPGEQGVQSAFSVNTSDNIYQGNINTLILQSAHFNSSHNSGEGVRSAPREILPNSVLSDMPVSVKQENEGQGNHGDSGEGASSDEKSGKSKSSPKRRSRKGRSTSSGAEMVFFTKFYFQIDLDKLKEAMRISKS